MKWKDTKVEESGWTDWISPVMREYRVGCCDCGLVHDIDFQVVRVLKRQPDGTKIVEVVESEDYEVNFRARRNNRSTGQKRRHRLESP